MSLFVLSIFETPDQQWTSTGLGGSIEEMNYYRRVLRTAWADFRAATRAQIIGALLTIAILFCQIRFGVIHQGDLRANVISVAWPYVLLLAALLLWSLVRVPRKLHNLEEQKNAEGETAIRILNAKLARAEQDYLDAVPQIGMNVVNLSGKPPRGAIGSVSLDMQFYFRHLSGRPATSLMVQPISSLEGRFSLRIGCLSYVAGDAEQKVGFEVWVNGERPFNRIIENAGWGKFLADFVFDSRSEGDTIGFLVIVGFRDRDEYREQRFRLIFDYTTYLFNVLDEYAESRTQEMLEMQRL